MTAALAALDPGALGLDALLDAATQWEQIRSWAEAMQNRVLVAWDGRVRGAERSSWKLRWHVDQLAVALGVGQASASLRLSHAVALAEELPHTREALEAGTITGHHARLAVTSTRTAGPDVARLVDAALHDPAAPHADTSWVTPRQLERAAATLVATVDPDGASRRHKAAVAQRDVRFRAVEDGMATMWALLPAADAQTVAAAIEARARASAAHPDSAADTRTLAQRRADALVALATGALAGPAAPEVHGRRPTVNLTVSWSTMMGLDDLPADLAGWGPIDADTARRIAADPTATWRRLLLDPVTGGLLDYGRTVYRPPTDLAAFVVARDGTCRHPACDRPAASADLDHRVRWKDDGKTAPDNLDALCRRHHRQKDEGGWAHARDPETGDSIWITPHGRRVIKRANRLPRPPNLGPPPF